MAHEDRTESSIAESGPPAGVKFGVLEFSYRNYHHFETQLRQHGRYTINLGDYIQSIAVREALISIGVRPEDIRHVDRDGLSDYRGDDLVVIMNGVFVPSNFPLSGDVTPVYFGFSYHPDNMFPGNTIEGYERSVGTLNPKRPVGCRDAATAEKLADAGFDTYVTGCLSQSLAPAAQVDRRGLPVMVCGVDNPLVVQAGFQQSEPLIYLPDQRMAVHEYPLSQETRNECRAAAGALLNFYTHHVSVAVTSLMHCASPCAALGIPAVIARRDPENLRFTSVRDMIPVISSDEVPNFSDLKAAARPIHVRDRMLGELRRAINETLSLSRSRSGV